jgi:8-oxo-dGTP pyrophosphatase MutT (NUDIX family)
MIPAMDFDPRLHFVVATAIIVQAPTAAAQGRGRYLIAKRAPHEKAFPSKWTVPGGKLVTHEYRALPKSVAGYEGWYGLLDWLVRKEVAEEVGLEIGPLGYVTDVVFFRPDGYPVVTLSFWAPYASGQVKLCKDLTDHAWVTLEEAKGYDLIEGILNELRQVDDMLRKTQVTG